MKIGDIVTIKDLPASTAKVIAKSKVTGVLTVEFTKQHQIYQKGDKLNVMPYDVLKIY